MIRENDLQDSLKSSFNYPEYKSRMENELNTFDLESADASTIERNGARKINLARMNRLEKQYQPENKSVETIINIKVKLLWVVISETWCGDSAQSLPVIAKLVSMNPMFELKITLRDKNPELMNEYLTNGKRSIPKLIIFDETYSELVTWGPRPTSAQNLMTEMLNENIDKSERLKRLHLWYAKNKGAEVEEELIMMLSKSLIPELNLTS